MPSIELKETLGCTKKFDVEIEQDRLDEQIQTTVNELKKDVIIPGFRKGRAPEALILRRFGPTIRQEAVRELIPKALQELFESEGLEPVNEPDISDLKAEENCPVTFTVSIEEVPEVDVSGFEGIKVTKEIREVNDELVDAEIERIRGMYAQQEDVERPAEENDILVVNLQKLDTSGVPIVGEKIENHVVALDGQSTPSPEFDEQVKGMSVGDRKTVRFTYDETINNPELVGQEEAYEVEVLRILINKIPEIDEEFLKNLGGLESVEQLKENTRTRLERQSEDTTNRKVRSDMIEEFVKQTPFEVPGSMVERVLQGEIQRYRQMSQNAPVDESALRDRLRPDAVRAVQTYILLDAIKEAQSIEVSKEDADARLAEIAEANGMEPKEFRRRLIKEGRFDEFKNDIATEKAYDWMLEVADVTEEKVEPGADAQE